MEKSLVSQNCIPSKNIFQKLEEKKNFRQTKPKDSLISNLVYEKYYRKFFSQKEYDISQKSGLNKERKNTRNGINEGKSFFLICNYNKRKLPNAKILTILYAIFTYVK